MRLIVVVWGNCSRLKSCLLVLWQINPDSREIRNNQANLLIDLGRLDEAREILTRLLDEQPDYADARANLNRLSFQNTPSNQLRLLLGEQSSECVQGLVLG